MASGEAEQEQHRDRLPLLMGRAWQQTQLARAGRDAYADRMGKRVGRQADLHRPCRGADDGKTPPAPLNVRVIHRPDSPSARHRLRRFHSAPFVAGGIALPTIAGGPDEPDWLRLGPFPITRSCRAMDQQASFSKDAHGICPDQWAAMDLPREIGHAEPKFFRPW